MACPCLFSFSHCTDPCVCIRGVLHVLLWDWDTGPSWKNLANLFFSQDRRRVAGFLREPELETVERGAVIRGRLKENTDVPGQLFLQLQCNTVATWCFAVLKTLRKYLWGGRGNACGARIVSHRRRLCVRLGAESVTVTSFSLFLSQSPNSLLICTPTDDIGLDEVETSYSLQDHNQTTLHCRLLTPYSADSFFDTQNGPDFFHWGML